MEYCENETLRQLIDAGQLHCDQELVWRLFRELAEGLEHIHSKVRHHLNACVQFACTYFSVVLKR